MSSWYLKKLEKHGFYVSGEYAYSRTNEHKVETEFSVDLHASDFLEHGTETLCELNFLVECKYNYPGVKWIFSPHPAETIVFANNITYLQDLCTKRLAETGPLSELDPRLEYCTRGIELHKNGADLNAISRGLNQLRYALPNLVAQECRSQMLAWHEDDLVVSLICPVLVTTASLNVLKTGLTLDTFQAASSLDEVATEVDALIVYQEPGPHLLNYCRQIARILHKQYPDIRTRLDEFEQILGREKTKLLPSTWAFNEHFSSVTQNILVVHLDALDQFLANARESAFRVGKTAEQVASLSVDLEQRTRIIVPDVGTET